MISTIAKATPSRKTYWLRLIRLFLFALTVAVVGLPLLFGVVVTLGLLYSPCPPDSLTPADFALPAESVTIEAQANGTFRGYYIPGTNGATIILPPPLNSGRGNRLPYAAILSRHGYAVFTFESRRCAGMGPLSLGYNEVNEVGDALAYVVSRSETDPNKVGVYGFSSAGATAIMAAARYPELKAVVAEGGYGDFLTNALGPNNGSNILVYSFIALYQWAMRVTYRLVVGFGLEQLSPVNVIDQIPPRPILLIYGSHEVSRGGGRQQAAAAGDGNAALWIVPGAGHGNYLQVAPAEYEQRIITFFDTAFFCLSRNVLANASSC